MDCEVVGIETNQAGHSPSIRELPPIDTIADLLSLALQTFQRDIDAAVRCVQEAANLLNDRTGPSAKELTKTFGSGGLTPWQISRIKEYLKTALEQNIRIAELAHAARLSRGHFNKAFRQSFGVSPYAYIMALRITHAKELMIETDLPLSQIALDCGLSDQAHLSRLFRREMGCAPNAWRRAKLAHIQETSIAPSQAPNGQRALRSNI
jgi:transcriptional regulator GlxA family with amidase domain